mgnify:CR=1 FL=1
MSIIVDLVILAIIILCIIIGYVRGLTGSLIKIVSFVLSIVIAFVLFIPISNLIINNTQIDENLEQSIREMIVGNDNKEENMPEAITDYIAQQIESASDSAKEAIADSTAREVSLTIVKAGTWIILFIVARILLIFLRFITSLIAKLPVIKQFDKLGGIIYGILEGLIIVYVLLAIISFVSPMVNGSLSNAIEESFVGSIMYNNNLLLKIIF